MLLPLLKIADKDHLALKVKLIVESKAAMKLRQINQKIENNL